MLRFKKITGLTIILQIMLYSLILTANPTLTIDFNQKDLIGKTPSGQSVTCRIETDSDIKKPTFSEGINGRNSVKIENGGLSVPLSEKYFNINNGSVIFWIKPENWGNGLISPGKSGLVLVPILAISNPGGYQWSQFLYLAINQQNGSTLLSYRSQVYEPQRRQVYLQEHLLKGMMDSNGWSMVAITWSNMELKTYINGLMIGSASYGLPINKTLNSEWKLWFMPTPWWNVDYTYKTQLSDIKIYDNMLNELQIKEIYNNAVGTGKTASKAETTIPQTDSVPKIDGIIGAAEWADASMVPLMRENGSGHINTTYPAWVMLKHDTDNLYIACNAVGKNIKCTGKDNQSDMNMFSGTEFEICWRLPESEPQKCFQIGMAPNNSYMSISANGELDKIKFDFKTQRTDSGWTVEAAIPLSQMGIKIPGTYDIQMLLHRPEYNDTRSNWIVWNLEKPGGKMFWENMGKAHFRTDNLAFQINEIGDLNYGGYNIKLAVTPKTKGEFNTSICSVDRIIEESSNAKHLSGIINPGVYDLNIKGTDTVNEKQVFNFSAGFNVKDPFSFEPIVYQSVKNIQLNVDAQGLQQKLSNQLSDGKVQFSACLSSPEGKTYGDGIWTMTKFKESFILQFTEMPEGEYTIKTSIVADGKSIERCKKFIRPSDIFLRDRKGLERTIPAPWKPLNLKGNTINTPFISYTFNDGAFPCKIVSHGEIVMNDEPQLLVKIGKQEYVFTPETNKNLEASADYIINTGVMKCSKANLVLDWIRKIHYDGLIRYDFKLYPSGGQVKIDGLRLLTKIPSKIAQYSLSPIYNPEWTTQNAVDVFPSAWLTNNQAGFNIFTDNDANWVYDEKTKPIKLRRTSDGGATIEAGLINSPVNIKQVVTYVIGMTGTPTKPPRSDWRNIHDGGWGLLQGQNIQIIGWGGIRNWIFKRVQSFSEPQDGNFKYWEDFLKKRKAKLSKLFPYGYLTAMPDNNPIFDYFGSEWLYKVKGFAPPRIERCQDKIDNEWFYLGVPVCLNKIGYADYLAYYVDQYMSRYSFIPGPYFDGSGVCETDTPYKDTNLKDVFYPERKVYNTNHFGMRDLYERFYRITRKHRGDDGLVFIHSWSDYRPSITSFVDIIYPGEEFMHSISNGLQVYVEAPLEQWQSNYSGKIYGTAVQFLSQYRNLGGDLINMPPEKRWEYTKPLLMMCLIHDVQLSGCWYPDVEKAWEILDKNQVTKADFNGYWKQDKIKTGNEQVKVSFYSWSNHQDRLLMIGNLSKQKQTVTLSLDSSFKARDEITGKPVDLRQPLTVENWGFRIIKLIQADSE